MSDELKNILIEEKRLTNKYYFDQTLSLFMNNSYGIRDFLDIFISHIRNKNEYYNFLFDKINIFRSSSETDYFNEDGYYIFTKEAVSELADTYNYVWKKYEELYLIEQSTSPTVTEPTIPTGKEKKNAIVKDTTHSRYYRFFTSWNEINFLTEKNDTALENDILYINMKDGYEHPLLDNIASIFKIKRENTITKFDGVNNNLETYNLTNKELLIYIKCKIIKNNYDGTRNLLEDFYKENGKTGLNFVYKNDQSVSGKCSIYFTNYTAYSEAIQQMFLNGLLAVESLGIEYVKVLENINDIAAFYETGTTAGSNNKFNGTEGGQTVGGRFA